MTTDPGRAARPRRVFRAVLGALLPTLLAACGDSTSPAAGRLVVTVAPLRADAQVSIAVRGPGAFTRTVSATDTLEGLRPGDYVVEAADVLAGGLRFRPTPATQTLTVAPGAEAAAVPVVYAIASASLAVEVGGLPPGATAAVRVSGPAGFTRTLVGSDTIDLLEPGEYDVQASDVTVQGRTFRASPGAERLTAVAPRMARASIWYGAGDATLSLVAAGLPAGVAARVNVTGPNGFARTVTVPATLGNLDPGTYTVTGEVAGRDLVTYRAGAPRIASLVAGSTSVLTTDYAGAPLELSLQVAAEGFAAPVFLTAPQGDPRLFVVERTGRVRVVKDGVVLPAPFVDLRAKVNAAGERGLLGMAFDPEYAATGLLYLYYVNALGDVVLERFSSIPGSDVASGGAGIVLAIAHGGAEHHGGMLAFGPDGMLHLAPGDGRCCGDPNNNAQNLRSLLGKMLRIDVRTTPYTVPPDNPFVGRADARPEIWSYGLRSPWRFAIDAASGLLFLADVGQDAREEVNIVSAQSAGRNFGWRLMEGTACYNPTSGCNAAGTLTLPAIEYGRADGCSVIGGFVYRGVAVPELAGRYLYSDFCRGWLRSAVGGASGAAERREWAGVSLPRVTSFGTDGAGELYMLAGGRAWRIARR